ncbi:gag-pol polyprotein [Tanacetum coccineum]
MKMITIMGIEMDEETEKEMVTTMRVEIMTRTREELGKLSVKYATCTFQDGALTWWNSHNRIVGTDAAYVMTWKELRKLMTEDAIQMANNLMVQKVRVVATRDVDRKRKWEDDQEGNHHQQQNKRQEVGRVYVTGTGNKTCHVGTLPPCDKCKLHHHGSCPVKYGNCKKVDHQVRDCWTHTTVTCYGCGEKGHTKRYYPGSENQNGYEILIRTLTFLRVVSCGDLSILSIFDMISHDSTRFRHQIWIRQLFFVYKDPIFELQDMSTFTTHQQSLADAGSETRPPMLERGPYEFKEFTPSESEPPRMQQEEDLKKWHTISKVTVNTKFLNYLQPEWLKYVTQVRLAKRLIEDTYDDLFDYLLQFEKLANVSRAKKLEKSHDPLALVAHTGSSSRITSPYYVTHPSLVVDYDDDYQGDAVQNTFEDPLTSAMIFLAREITQRFSNPTNNRLRTSSNTKNQAIVQADKRTLQTTSLGTAANVQCYNCSEKGHYARNCPKPRVRDSKYFMEQMLLVK